MVVELKQKFAMPMQHVAAGPFVMGDVDSAFTGGMDLRTRGASLSGYHIARYPVTLKMWRSYADDSGKPFPISEELIQALDLTPDHPIVQVSWYDCQDFCAWLSQQCGRLCRIPTEAQWEKACRGRNGQLFPIPHEPNRRMRALEDKAFEIQTRKREQEALLKPHLRSVYYAMGEIGFLDVVTPFGCHDMCVNFAEWTQDWLTLDYMGEWMDEPDGAPFFNDPLGPPTGKTKVLKGGGMPDMPTCHRRFSREPNYKSAIYGFRFVIEGSAPT